MDYPRILEQVITACRDIGREEVMPRYLKVAHQRKVDGSLLTEADLAAQNALIRRLREILPLPVLGEEMSEAEQHALWEIGDEGLWCVDPIDGTSNFVNGLPFFAISVALMVNRRSVLGVVYDPSNEEAFYAIEGQGAWVNGERLPVKLPPESLGRCMAGIELKRIDRELAGRLAFEHPFSSQRNLGASTLDWCYLASGRMHLYLHGGQKLWDYAAGSLILFEAGGAACSMRGDNFFSGSPWSRSVIAALTPDLLGQWQDWLGIRPPLHASLEETAD
ncbi:MAG: inositol monophosphatase family protein [Betaproteobacteria bacterium]|nr:inositol monophosphatase family protein [Betaproteobacteria bacterium]